MADYDEFDEGGGVSALGLLRAAYGILGVVEIAFFLVGGIVALVLLSNTDALNGITALATVGLMLWGMFSGLVLLAFGETIRRFVGIHEATERMAAALRDWSPGRMGASPSPQVTGTSDALDEVVVLMREVRDISLLTEEQRSLRLQAQGRAALNHLQREVPVLLREHNWIEARNRVEEARERFPSFAEWDELETQIEQMRAQVEAHDIEAAQRQIDDLASLGAWDRVAEVLTELLERHPDSVKANELAQKVRGQRNKAEAEQRERLMAQAQEATNAREWKKALSLATALIQRYPRSPEAQALRMQLPTLQENAEIQVRHRMESEIRDLIKERRFDEALRTANELLHQYPDSPQAAALREQLPRLEEMATTMGARY